MPSQSSNKVRQRLNHPVVDGDGHWIELRPIFLDYLMEVAGSRMVDRYRGVEAYAAVRKKGAGTAEWYSSSPDERMRHRMRRNAWWTHCADTLDRGAAHLPKLFYERLDEWGIDVALVFPTMGISFLKMTHDDQLRDALVRSYNVMVADMFKPYSDRVLPAACIALNLPAEAIGQLEHAKSLGLRVAMMNGTIVRPIAADADWQPDVDKRRVYVDGVGLDSPHDYDPVWRKCVELGMAVNNHVGSNPWPDRTSTSNYVANHIGHLGQSHHLFARHLFMGGVCRRFPALNFGFLEGGVGWACNLFFDLIGHWEKRNRDYMHKHLRPDTIDQARLRDMFVKYSAGNPRIASKIDAIFDRNLEWTGPDSSLEELSARDSNEDDFAKAGIKDRDGLCSTFRKSFYFGCEADDPMTAVAFNAKMGSGLKPVFGSDITHFDVMESTQVLAEAWELVEKDLISEDDFRAFTFANAVQLHGGMNPDFFKGTVIEEQARLELARSRAAG